jgi:hypothetical protein
VDIWSKRTILDALPDEAKDLEKQKAGRLSQKEVNSAAVSAAPKKKKEEEQIIIDTQGKPVEKDTPSRSPLTITTLISSIDVSSLPSDNNNDNQLQNNDDDLLKFEFSLPSQCIWNHIFPFVLAKENEKNL